MFNVNKHRYKKVYIYDPKNQIKNIYVTSAEIGPYDIIYFSTEIPPLEEMEGFHVVFNEEKGKWVYQIDLNHIFYNPEDGSIIDNRINMEYARLSAEDFNLDSLKQLVKTPPPEKDPEALFWVGEKYKWNYDLNKWELIFDAFKKESLKNINDMLDAKISALSKDVPLSEKETFDIQYEEALNYQTKKKTKEKIDIEQVCPNLYNIVMNRFKAVEKKNEKFEVFFEEKITKILHKAEELNEKKMYILGTYQGMKENIKKSNNKKEIIGILKKFNEIRC